MNLQDIKGVLTPNLVLHAGGFPTLLPQKIPQRSPLKVSQKTRTIIALPPKKGPEPDGVFPIKTPPKNTDQIRCKSPDKMTPGRAGYFIF